MCCCFCQWSRGIGRLSLEVVSDLRGAVGLYVPGLVVLALADSEWIARRILATRLRQATPWERRRQPERIITFAMLLRSVRRSVLAHEIGHALRHQQNASTPFRNEELAADYLAGRIDAALGWRSDIGVVVFETLGCLADACGHPAPDRRRSAYLRGYRDRLDSRPVPASDHLADLSWLDDLLPTGS